MRVLWFTPSPGLYSPKPYGTWVEALQNAIMEYGNNIEIALCFEDSNVHGFNKVIKDNFTYYPVCAKNGLKGKLMALSSPQKEYQMIRPLYIKAINDFRPDIIQCFGTELWHYSLLANEVDIPMVIHIMGFQNIYNDMGAMVEHKADIFRKHHYNPFSIFRYAYFRKRKNLIRCQMELEEMKINHYFMGRTEWDKNIVHYFSPGSVYYYCAEAIRPMIYESKKIWEYQHRKKLHLITIGSGSGLKGNEIILKTASILKNLLHVDFEWTITTSPAAIAPYEKNTGIRHSDVNLNLIGRISTEQIVEQLTTSDIYIHSAIIDNSPNTICESQLLGIPVIATNVGGIPQLVENGNTGILYPYNESYTLAFTIMNLWHDKEKMQMLSHNEYEMAHKRHNPKNIVNTLEDIYKNIISDYRQGK